MATRFGCSCSHLQASFR